MNLKCCGGCHYTWIFLIKNKNDPRCHACDKLFKDALDHIMKKYADVLKNLANR